MIHTGQKDFECGFCDYRCNTRSNQRKHWRTVHKKDNYDNRQNTVSQLYTVDSEINTNVVVTDATCVPSSSQEQEASYVDELAACEVLISEGDQSRTVRNVTQYTVLAKSNDPLDNQGSNANIVTMPLEYISEQTNNVPMAITHSSGQTIAVMTEYPTEQPQVTSMPIDYQVAQSGAVSIATEYTPEESKDMIPAAYEDAQMNAVGEMSGVTIATEYPPEESTTIMMPVDYPVECSNAMSASRVCENEETVVMEYPSQTITEHQEMMPVSTSQSSVDIQYPPGTVVMWTQAVVQSDIDHKTDTVYTEQPQDNSEYQTQPGWSEL